MLAKIYKPAKNAMQSGQGGNGDGWLLEYEPARTDVDPLMGWTSGDTTNQIRMRFATKEEAIAFAERHAIQFVVEEPHPRAVKPKAYSDNFAFNRVVPWTH